MVYDQCMLWIKHKSKTCASVAFCPILPPFDRLTHFISTACPVKSEFLFHRACHVKSEFLFHRACHVKFCSISLRSIVNYLRPSTHFPSFLSLVSCLYFNSSLITHHYLPPPHIIIPISSFKKSYCSNNSGRRPSTHFLCALASWRETFWVTSSTPIRKSAFHCQLSTINFQLNSPLFHQHSHSFHQFILVIRIIPFLQAIAKQTSKSIVRKSLQRTHKRLHNMIRRRIGLPVNQLHQQLPLTLSQFPHLRRIFILQVFLHFL